MVSRNYCPVYYRPIQTMYSYVHYALHSPMMLSFLYICQYLIYKKLYLTLKRLNTSNYGFVGLLVLLVYIKKIFFQNNTMFCKKWRPFKYFPSSTTFEPSIASKHHNKEKCKRFIQTLCILSNLYNSNLE